MTAAIAIAAYAALCGLVLPRIDEDGKVPAEAETKAVIETEAAAQGTAQPVISSDADGQIKSEQGTEALAAEPNTPPAAALSEEKQSAEEGSPTPATA